ncbi:MAG: hypothetical protein M0Z50_09260 [Planctomycetia bacterium]|nr:hypothetical protein [Planctomycetia bacterium]
MWWQDGGTFRRILRNEELGHRSQQTTAVYARLAQDPVADGWQKGTDAILVAAGVKPSAEVVPMKKGRKHA